MSWTKLGDEFAFESEDLSDAAMRTHIDALIYSNTRLRDFLVPKKALVRFANSDLRITAAAELVAAGWWEDRGEEWFIGCRFPEWQRERAEVEHRRAYLREAQMRSRRHRRGDHSTCLPSTCAKAMSTALSTVDSTLMSTGDRGVESTDPPQDGSGRDGTGRDYVPPVPSGAPAPAGAPGRENSIWSGEPAPELAGPDGYVNGAALARAALEKRFSEEIAQ